MIYGFSKSLTVRFSIGMGAGLIGGTLPSRFIKSIATEAGFLPGRINNESFQPHSVGEPTLRWQILLYIIEETVIEEFFFRGFLQGGILNRFPEFVAKRILKKENLITKSIYAKTIRIFFTSAVFSYSHAANEEMPANTLKAQILGSFIGGICLGCIKESRLGLAGAVGGHIANNLFPILTLSLR